MFKILQHNYVSEKTVFCPHLFSTLSVTFFSVKVDPRPAPETASSGPLHTGDLVLLKELGQVRLLDGLGQTADQDQGGARRSTSNLCWVIGRNMQDLRIRVAGRTNRPALRPLFQSVGEMLFFRTQKMSTMASKTGISGSVRVRKGFNSSGR